MFFKNLLNKMKNRKPMMANRMGGFLRNRPQLMERLRNAKSMRGMGRGMMNPNMQFGIMGLNPMMARSMKAKMMGLPDPKDFDANNLPFPQPGQRSDIMPRDPGFGFNMPKRPPIMPGVMPQPSGPDGPIRSVIEPVEGTIQPPKYYNQDEYMPKAPIVGMKEGGEAKKYPNAGLAALAEERPDVVKRMGYAPGGEVTPGFFGDPKARNLYKGLIEQGFSPEEAERIANNRLKEANMKKIFDRSEAEAQKRMDKSNVKNLKMLGRLGKVGVGGIAGLGLLALDPDVRGALGRFPQYQDPFEGVVPYGVSKYTPDAYQLSNFLTAEVAGRPDRAFSLPGLKQSMEAAVAAGEPTFEYRLKNYNTEEVMDFFNNQ